MTPPDAKRGPGQGLAPNATSVTAIVDEPGVTVPLVSVCVVACAAWSSCPHACHVAEVNR